MESCLAMETKAPDAQDSYKSNTNINNKDGKVWRFFLSVFLSVGFGSLVYYIEAFGNQIHMDLAF